MQSGQEIRALTGLRGLAACLVVLYHQVEAGSLPTLPLIGPVVARGYLSVDVFFVLSGFVMGLSSTHLFTKRPLQEAYAVFLLRRMARIYPLYFFVLILATIQEVRHNLQHHQDIGWLQTKLPMNLFPLHGLGIGERIVGTSWSIGAEFAAYLVFPLLLWLTLEKRRVILSVILAACALIVAAYCPTSFPKSGPLDVYWVGSLWPAIRCLAEFTLGLITCRSALRLRPFFSQPLPAFAVLAALVLLSFMAGTDIAFVLFIPPFLLTLLSQDRFAARMLSSSPLLFLGEVSFAVYLCHKLLMPLHDTLLARLQPSFMPAAAQIASETLFWCALLGAAWLCHRRGNLTEGLYIGLDYEKVCFVEKKFP
ncbi:acyltransferase family protein [Acetobacter estunensis]|uniref:Acyltransferase family protein n=2 Tax=Acetobacter estunensis TaxID=104097 RepID=A0A967B6W6_9PROT|nr:acyltransferase [Acetobacter estunensis]NHO54972.1 acyltransferase family protein [Acetobacter estunensis]